MYLVLLTLGVMELADAHPMRWNASLLEKVRGFAAKWGSEVMMWSLFSETTL